MIFDFLKKQKEITEKRKIIEIMISSLNISDDQKELYKGAMGILNNNGLENLFNNLIKFTKELEEEELINIGNNNFYQISGMRKKEALEKKKELNSFSFLISNI